MTDELRKIHAYLIQRGTFRNNESKKGIDKIISFDYMGASEFEWGALPDSLEEIRNAINDYIIFNVAINGKITTVFCNKKHEPDIREYLEKLAHGKFYLHEYSDYDNYIYGSKDVPFAIANHTDFWWDIVNDIMFWKINKDFETKFLELIKIKPE